MEVVTVSRLRAYQVCRKLHHFSYVLGLSPRRPSAPLVFGAAVHRALETWWRGAGTEATLSELDRADLDPYQKAKARAMLLGYIDHWSGSGFTSVEVENEFSMPLSIGGIALDGWRVAGKIDVIARAPDGSLWIIEHKTASPQLEHGVRKLSFDSQVFMYLMAAQNCLGYEVEGVLYDVLVKPLQRPSKDETPMEFERRLLEEIQCAPPGKYYKVHELRRSEEEMQQWVEDFEALVMSMIDDMKASRAPRNPDACFRYGQECSYFALCAGECGIDDPRYVLSRPHRELSDALLRDE